MGAPHEGCPTCGAQTAPATPQQEEEQRPSTNGVAAKSLTERFATLEVARPSTVSKESSDGGEVPSTSNGNHPVKDNLRLHGDHGRAARAPAGHDADEPILQDNDERFCLLPVK